MAIRPDTLEALSDHALATELARDQSQPLRQILRQLRCKGGWTRREVAEAAGLSENAVRDYEQGKRMPSLENAARLALALGTDLNELGQGVRLREAFALPQGLGHASRITFGQYKGQWFRELPTGYLEWLIRERRQIPLRLWRSDQREEVKRILKARAERARPAAQPAPTSNGRPSPTTTKPQPTPDPVLERARREREQKKRLDLDPAHFGKQQS